MPESDMRCADRRAAFAEPPWRGARQAERRSQPCSPALPDGETQERLLILLLIILLIREKSDPLLIAALVYLLI